MVPEDIPVGYPEIEAATKVEDGHHGVRGLGPGANNNLLPEDGVLDRYSTRIRPPS